LTLFSFPPAAQAGELGRLFFTPQQRQQLEMHDTGSSSGNNDDNIGRRSSIVVNGVVQKNGGNRTVWINGEAQAAERGNDSTPVSIPVTVPGKKRPVQLKVGQRLILDAPAQGESSTNDSSTTKSMKSPVDGDE
jgi:hypothetical protein